MRRARSGERVCSTPRCKGVVTGDKRRRYCDKCRPPELRNKWRRHKAYQREDAAKGAKPRPEAGAKKKKKKKGRR